jgi:hypothetical protein
MTAACSVLSADESDSEGVIKHEIVPKRFESLRTASVTCCIDSPAVTNLLLRSDTGVTRIVGALLCRHKISATRSVHIPYPSH